MKYEKDSEVSYTLGAFPTYELLINRPYCVMNVYFHDKTKYTEDINKIIDYCNANGIKHSVATKKINSIASKENVFVMAEFKKYPSEKLTSSKQIVLVNPSDMGNAGTIMRTALGFGYKDIILITPCIDIFNPKVIRSSMGAIFSLNIKYYSTFEEYVKENQDIKKYLFMLDGETILQEMRPPKDNYALIFGNEATGLDSALKKYGEGVFIRHTNKIDSLNLSISIGMAIYEFSK